MVYVILASDKILFTSWRTILDFSNLIW